MSSVAELQVETAYPYLGSQILSWVDSFRTQFHWSANVWSHTVQLFDIEERVAKIQSDHQRNAYILRDLTDNSVVGYFELSTFDEDNHIGRLGMFLLDPDKRGRGLGQQAMELIEDLFFNQEEGFFHRLELVVATDNPSAITCYEKAGFTTEGVFRESRKFGDEWREVQLMSLLRHEWETLRETR